jgi:hypothetical protein
MVDPSSAFRGRSIRFAQGLTKINPGTRKKVGPFRLGLASGKTSNVGRIPGRVPETLEENVALSLSQTTARKGFLG